MSTKLTHSTPNLARFVGGLLIGCLALLAVVLLLRSTETVSAAGATILVNSSADTVSAGDGQCTLREAINNANADADTTGGDCAAGAGDDTITVPAGTYTTDIAGTDEDANADGDFNITDSDNTTTIQGASARDTIIQAAATAGTATESVFDITGNATITFNNLTIRYGSAQTALVKNNGTGSLTLDTVAVVSNGAGLSFSQGVLTIVNSLFANNTDTPIDITTTVSGRQNALIANTTISGNSSPTGSAGVSVSSTNPYKGGYDVIVRNSTVVNNSSSTTANNTLGALNFSWNGVLFLDNSLVTGNTTQPSAIASNCQRQNGDSILRTLGDNVVGSNGSAGGCTVDVDDIVPTGDPSTVVDLTLADNGGETDTHAITSSSDAFDIGDDCSADAGVNDIDQRGEARDSRCDAGAFELPLPPGQIVVTSANDDATASDGACTLREAINNANANADTTSGDCSPGVDATDSISFDIGGGGTQTITLGAALPDLTDGVTIDGTTQPSYTTANLILVDAAAVSGAILAIRSSDVTLNNFSILNASGTPVDAHSGANISLDGMDLSKTGTATGIGFRSRTAAVTGAVVQNSDLSGHGYGVYADGGEDLTLLNNDLSDSASYAIYLRTVAASSLSGGVAISGNTYTDSAHGLFFELMADLVISNGTISGTNVTLDDSLRSVTDVVLLLNGVQDVLIEALDFGYAGVTATGYGVEVLHSSSRNVVIQNNSIRNRAHPVIIRDGQDIQLIGNDLSDASIRPIHMQSVAEFAIAGGVLITDNVMANSPDGAYFETMDGLIISDGTISGTNVTLDPAFLQTTTGTAIRLHASNNVLIDGLDMSWSDVLTPTGRGVYVTHSLGSNIVIQNSNIANRTNPIQVDDGVDIQVLNNDLSGTTQWGLILKSVAGSSLPGGVLVAGNDMTNRPNGIYLETMDGLIISDGTISGTNVTLDPAFLQTTTGTAIRLHASNNVLIDGLDMSWPEVLTPTGRGVHVTHSLGSNIVIQNSNIANRVQSVQVDDGSDMQVLNNDLSGTADWGLILKSIAAATLPGGVLVEGNDMNGRPNGIYLETMDGLIISDGTISGTNVTLDPAFLQTTTGTAIRLHASNNVLIDGLDMSWSDVLTPTGRGVYVTHSLGSNIVIQNSNIANRAQSVQVDDGSDMQVLNNDLSGTADWGLILKSIAAATLPGGVLVEGNDMTGRPNGIYLETMDGLIISDGTISGTNVTLDPAFLQTTTGTAIRLHASDNVVIDGLDTSFTGDSSPSGTGVHVTHSGSSNITVQNGRVGNREFGIKIDDGVTYSVSCVAFVENEVGLWSAEAMTVTNSIFNGNTIHGIVENGSDEIVAENNYWGSADGPSNLGGSGDSYSGSVDADPFLSNSPVCLNTAPTANDDTVTTPEDTPISINVVANDVDPENDPLNVAIDTNPTNGQVSVSGGTIVYTPTLNVSGTDIFGYIVSDGTFTDTATVTVTVTPVNDPPVAVDDTTSTNEDSAVTIDLTDNDSDVELDSLTVIAVSSPSNGSVTIISASDAVYTPTADFNGVDVFTYTVSDGALSSAATVTVTVSAENDPPVLNGIGDQSADEATELTFTASATDVDGDTLTFSLENAPAGATITSGGAFTWTPTEVQGPGTYTLTVRVTDNGTPALDDAETLTITVNEVNVAPVLDAIGDQSVDEGSELSFTATATDGDQPANALTFSLENAPVGASITTGGDFTWTPTEAQGAGTYSMTIRVTDDGSPSLSDSETIIVNVNEVNVAPVLDGIGDQSVDEETELRFTATASDSDLPANTLTFSLENAPAGAAITSGGEFTWTPTEAQGAGTYTLTVRVTDNGTPALDDSETIVITVNEANIAPVLATIGDQAVDEGQELSFVATATDADEPANTLIYSIADAPSGSTFTNGVFTWTPSESDGGNTFDVTITVDDGNSGVDSETLTITVNEVNVAPVLDAIGDQSVDEGSELSFTATATDGDQPANALTFSLENAPVGASITTGGDFTWTPTETQGPGTYTLTVRVTDNGVPALDDNEIIVITVNEANIAPVLATIGDQSVDEGQELTFTATATDADEPANTLTYSITDAPSGSTFTDGLFTWTPSEADGGNTFDVTVTVDDGSGGTDSETLTITVNEVNVAPVLDAIGDQSVDEGVELSFTATATDGDQPANALTFSLENAPTGASITTGGDFTWAPTEAQGPNTYTLTVRVTDNGTPSLSDFEVIQITVSELNVAPILNTIGNQSIDEGAELSFSATATDADEPANTLTFTFENAPVGAAITANGDFTWTPTEAQGPGTYTMTMRVTDDGTPSLDDSETIVITVNEANIAPVLATIGDQSVDEGQELTFAATATDVDEPANTLTYSIADAPSGSTFTDGEFTWTPSEADGGNTFDVTVTVDDGMGGTDSETFTITVNEVNVVPVLNAIGDQTIDEESELRFTATATDSDNPANTLIFTLEDAPNGAVISNDGNFAWTPTESQGAGTYSMTVRVTDDGSPALSDSETIVVTVNEVNVAPVLATIGDQVVDEGQELTFTATATDADEPANTLTYSLENAPTGASVTNDGDFTWTPTEAQGSGTYTVTVRVTDDGTPILDDSETIVITVNEVNVAPVLDAIDDQTVAEGVTLNFTAHAADSDQPANALTFTLENAPAGATISSGGDFTWTPSEVQGPNAYTVTVRVTDDGTPVLSDAETFVITVTEENTPPVLDVIGDQVVDEGTELSFTATATDGDVRAPNNLTFSLDAGAPTGASITDDGQFTWTPTEAQGAGTYSVTVRVTDDGTPTLDDAETIQITVNEVNVAPVLEAIGDQTVDEGTLLQFTATSADADEPANTLTFSLENAPTGASITSGGDFTWTPSETQGPGTYTLTVRVIDDGIPALDDSETVVITVNEANIAPVLATIGDQAVDEGQELTFAATATDVDEPANVLTYSIEDAPSGSTFVDGVFTWTPSEADGGNTFDVTVTVDDGNGGTDSETLTITINEVNVAPVLAAIGDKSISEGAELSFSATATDADTPANTLTFTLENAPVGAAISADGQFTWTSTEAQGPNTYTVTVRVTDDGSPALDDVTTFVITVTEENTPPVLDAIGDQVVDEGTELSFTATATDGDVRAPNHLTFSLDAGAPTGASITDDGQFTWTPSEAQGAGTYSVTVRVTDDGTPSLSDFEVIEITVNEVNVAPVLDAIGDQIVDEGTELSFAVTAADADLPANTLTFSLENAPTGANITNDGDFTLTPTEAQGAGTYSITIRVTDDGTPALFDSETIVVTVEEVNVAPVLTAIGGQTVAEGTTLTFTASATDSDRPINGLTFSLENAPVDASITNGGEFTWTPTETQGPNTYTVTVRVMDDGIPALDDAETFVITVTEENTPPILDTIGDQVVDEGIELSFTATATDGDVRAPNNLTFSLDAGAPTGASITDDGQFTWTPSEAQGAGSYSVTIRVTDDGIPPLDDSETIQITVNEVNVAPVLAAIGDQTVDEETTLQFAATASDSDLPANGLTFSLEGAPDGASISADGQFTWTPSETQGPNTYTLTVRVTDDGSPTLTDSEIVVITVNEVNIAPVAVADDATVAEDDAVTIDVLDNDSDADGNSLHVASVTQGVSGVVTINGDGAVVYTPSADFNGTDAFSYVVSDGVLTATATVAVVVTSVNDAPLAVDDSYAVDENMTLQGALSVLENDSDIDGDSLSATLVQSTSNGALVFNADGTFVYTPTHNFSGSDSFTYVATDGAADSLVATVTILVNYVNRPPVGVSDVYTTAEDSALAVSAPGVLANDSDVDNDPLTAILRTRPSRGALSFNANGSFAYVPATNFNGMVQFSYVVNDSAELSEVVWVTIEITAVNDVPTISNIDDLMTNEDIALESIAFTLGDVETGAGALTVSAESSNPTLLPVDNIQLGGGGANRTVTLRPAPNHSGTVDVTLTVSDGTDSSATTFTVVVNPVNDAPTAIQLDTNEIAENLPVGTLVGTLSAADVDANDTHTYALVAGNGDVDNGDFTIVGNQLRTNAIFDYEGEQPTRTIRVRVTDLAGRTFGRVLTITITDANDAPSADDDFAQTQFATPVDIAVLNNDSDADGDALSLQAVGNPISGTVTIVNNRARYTPADGLIGTDTFTYTVSDGADGVAVATVTVLVNPDQSEDVQAVNDVVTTMEDTAITLSPLTNDSASVPLTLVYVSRSAHGTTTRIGNDVRFQPALNFSGVATFTYAVQAGQIGGGSAQVTVNVLPVNDAPVAASDDAESAEQIPVIIDVLANDSDPDGDAIQLFSVGHGDHGFVTKNADGTVTYQPDDGFFGDDQFTYQVVDGKGGSASGSVYVTIVERNRRPSTTADEATTAEDVALTLNVVRNDTDPNVGDTLRVVSVGQPQNGTTTRLANGQVRYKPFVNFSGVDTFGYIIRDSGGLEATGTVSVTVEAVTDPPVANPAFGAGQAGQPISGINVLDDVANADGLPLAIESFTQPECGTVSLSADGSFDFEPDPEFNGICTFDYTVMVPSRAGSALNDARSNAQRSNTVTLAVGEVESDLEAGDGSESVEQGAQLAINPLALIPDNQLASLALIGLQRRVGIASSNPDGTISYAPPLDYAGTDTITYTVSDGQGGIATGVITITIDAVNRPPRAQTDWVTSLEDQPKMVNVLANDLDWENETLTVTQVMTPAHGTVEISADGNVLYTPPANFSGVDTFGYTVVDPHGLSSIGTAVMIVANVNDAPVARDDLALVQEDTYTFINVIGNDRDVDGDRLQVTTGEPQHGSVTVTPVGSLAYQPDPDFFGSDVITYTVSDGWGGVAHATLTITVQAVNDAPIAVSDVVTVTAGMTVTIAVLDNDSDVDSEQLFLMDVTGGNGQAVIAGDTVVFAASADQVGSVTLTYTVADEQGATSVGQIIIDIESEAEPPTFRLFMPLLIRETD